MTSKLKKLKDLNRKLTVSVDTKSYNHKYTSKLNNIKKNAKIDGFRKGMVPEDVIIQRHGPTIHYEVLNELIQETYPVEIKSQNLKPASAPKINIKSEDANKGISYTAEFEVFPEFKPKISRWAKYDEVSINIDEDDIDLAVKDILSRYGHWHDIDRAAQKDDQVIINFEGKIDNEVFEGSAAKDYALVLGSNSMIPGFEDAIIGKKINDQFTFKVNFPEDYFKSDLAGKETEFSIDLQKVQEKHDAKLDKDLYKQLAMEGVKNKDDFRNEIHERMKQEVSQQEQSLIKESIYEAVLATNKFEVPVAVVNEQSTLMRKDSLMRVGQNEEDAPDDLFPVESFYENALKRVKLDLLFAELIKMFDLKVEKSHLDEFVQSESIRYKDPEQFKTWIKSQPKQLESYKMIILEDLLIEKLKKELKSKEKVINFKDLAKTD